MIELDALVRAGVSQEVLARQGGDERSFVARDLRPVARDDRVERMRGDRQSLEEPPCTGR